MRSFTQQARDAARMKRQKVVNRLCLYSFLIVWSFIIGFLVLMTRLFIPGGIMLFPVAAVLSAIASFLILSWYHSQRNRVFQAVLLYVALLVPAALVVAGYPSALVCLVLYIACFGPLFLYGESAAEILTAQYEEEGLISSVRFHQSLGVLAGGVTISLASLVPPVPMSYLHALLQAACLLAFFLTFRDKGLRVLDIMSSVRLRPAIRAARAQWQKIPIASSFLTGSLFMVLIICLQGYLILGQFLVAFPGREEELIRMCGILIALLGFSFLLIVRLSPGHANFNTVKSASILFPVTSAILIGAFSLNHQALGLAIALFMNCFVLGLSSYSEGTRIVLDSFSHQAQKALGVVQRVIITPLGVILCGALLLLYNNFYSPDDRMGIALAGVMLSLFVAYLYGFLRSDLALLRLSTFKESISGAPLTLKGFASLTSYDATEILQGIFDFDDKICLFSLHSLRKVKNKKLVKPLLEVLPKKGKVVQAEIISLLGEMKADKALGVIREFAGSSDPLIRSRSIQALGNINPDSAREVMEAGLLDEHPEVRAQAAILACQWESHRNQGISVIQSMLTGEGEDMQCWGAFAAGQTRNKGFFYHLVPMLSSPHFSVRLKAMEAMGNMLDYLDRDYRPIFLHALGDSVPAIRLTSLRILANFGSTGLVDAVASLLRDRNFGVRREAIATLVSFGEEILDELKSYLYHDDERVVESALIVATELHTRGTMDFLLRFLDMEFAYVYRNLRSMVFLKSCEVGQELLIKAFEDYNRRSYRHAFILLEELDGQKTRFQEEAFFSGSSGQAPYDLNLITEMERKIMDFFTPLLENSTLEGKAGAGARRLPEKYRKSGTLEDMVEENLHHPDRWVREATCYFIQNCNRVELLSLATGELIALKEGGRKMMDEILVLKKIPIFEDLALELLMSISEITEERCYYPDDLVFEEGDTGDEIYLIYSGKVKIFRKDREGREIVLAMLGEKDYFGEMALLDDAPRSASAEVLEPSVLSVLNREKLYNIIYEKPDIAIGICRVLSARLREANKRIQEEVEKDKTRAS